MRVRGVCIILLLAILDTHLIHAVQYTYITGGVQGKSVAQGTGSMFFFFDIVNLYH